jgi:hypothetical protein
MLSVVAYTYNSSTQEAEEGGSWLRGKPGIYNKTKIGNNIKTKTKQSEEIKKSEHKPIRLNIGKP